MTAPRVVQVGPLRVDDDQFVARPLSLDNRSRPAVTPESQAFWDGLRAEKLVLDRCTSCLRWTHVSVGACQWCGGPVAPTETDPTAVVNTFTVCYLEFGPGLASPYIAAHVNPVVEPALQITTNLVDCRISDVRCGMALTPVFVHGPDMSLLFFRPRE